MYSFIVSGHFCHRILLIGTVFLYPCQSLRYLSFLNFLLVNKSELFIIHTLAIRVLIFFFHWQKTYYNHSLICRKYYKTGATIQKIPNLSFWTLYYIYLKSKEVQHCNFERFCLMLVNNTYRKQFEFEWNFFLGMVYYRNDINRVCTKTYFNTNE